MPFSAFREMVNFFFFLSFSRYAESVGAKHYHTSAKLNKGIEELFLDLCKRTLRLHSVFVVSLSVSHNRA